MTDLDMCYEEEEFGVTLKVLALEFRLMEIPLTEVPIMRGTASVWEKIFGSVLDSLNFF